MTDFADLGLSSWIIKQCKTIGVKSPTPIQQNCIPAILSGKNCIGCAKTGSGKTLAFALPILQKLSEEPYGIFALILTPTRELAFQIADQFAAIGKSINLKKCTIVGGMDMVIQGLELAKHPHIVVATPGRLADHLQSCHTFSLQRIKFLVLDEADRLLGGHFDEQIQVIFQALPKERQSLLFSATITDALDKVRSVSKKEFFTWDCKDDTGLLTVKELDQRYVLCPSNVRDAYLVEVIRIFRADNSTGSVMIFTDTCKSAIFQKFVEKFENWRLYRQSNQICLPKHAIGMGLRHALKIQCQLISMTLNEVGFENVALHAMMKQRDRLGTLSKFKSNHTKILIATDVAARGLDIPIVALVINHNIPTVPKEYVHRVGRTARAGRSGMAISLVTPHDIQSLQAIEATVGTKLSEFKVDDKEVATIVTQVSVTKREAEITLDENDFYEKRMINKRKKLILEGREPEEADELLKKERQKKQKKKKRKKRTEEDETEIST